MYSKAPILSALFVCALLPCCHTSVSLSTDGALTEHAVIIIAPSGNQAEGAAPAQAYYAREGSKGSLSFNVPASLAQSTFAATLVPDYRQTGNEIRRTFVPAQTSSLLFTPAGITAQPRKRK